MEKFVVSARKYRPSTFDEMVGQEAITKTLKNAIRNNHIAQAFLFTGPRGIGKTSCSRIFAKTINCQNLQDNIEPCNTCESCKSFNSSSSFNIHELDAASNNSVDDIRRLVEQVRIPPQVGKYKVYIIDEVHMLSQAAFNAFLKTLEEPPEYAKFILATTEKHKIIPTILSRCQIYDFNRINIADIVKHLQYVAESEGIVVEEKALHIIAKKADGALRDALSIFDQLVSFTGNNITYAHTIENLNVLDVEYYFKLTGFLLQGDVTSSLLLYDEIIARGFDGHHFINGIADHFRELLVVKDIQTLKLMESPESIKQQFAEQSKFCTIKWIVQALEICSNVDLNYKASMDKRLFVELNLLKLCNLAGPLAEIGEMASIESLPKTSISSTVKDVKKVQSEPEIKKAPISKKAESKGLTPPPAEVLKQTPPPAEPKEKAEPEVNKQAPKLEDEKPKEVKPKLKGMKSMGFSIKNDLKKQGLKEEKKTDFSSELNQSFDKIEHIIPVDDFKEAIEEYAKKIKTDKTAFSVALDLKNIQFQKDNTIHIVFSNQAMDDRDLKYGLLKFLKNKFNNNQIMLTTEVVEEEVVLKDEPMENYIKMKEKHPIVEKIRTQLDLDF